MKALTAVVTSFLESRTSRSNLLALLKLLGVLVLLIAIFSTSFHYLMAYERQDHSWMTGIYWTLTVMTTLGFGDITFESDLGRAFSAVVMVTGVMFLLVLLPFTFIEFFYAPWMKAQARAQAPRELPPEVSRHVLLTRHGPIAKYLIKLLRRHHYDYYLLAPTLAEALELHEQNVPVVATATSDAGRDALELAGASKVLQLEHMMGQTLARRVIDRDATAHLIGELDGLHIAEASVAGTPLVGRSIADSGLRSETGVSVVGFWDHGVFKPVQPESKLETNSIIVLAGTPQQIENYNRRINCRDTGESFVVIIGSGRVGRATAAALTERKIKWHIIEQLSERVQDPRHATVGDAAKLEVMVAAGVRQASSVLITTHDDDTNIFLTILYRRLRPNLQIITRCASEPNVQTLHRAGADLVLSYASMGANTIFNELRGSDSLLLAEGVNLFPVHLPDSLAGRTIRDSSIRPETGCTIIAVGPRDQREINPSPDTVLQPATEILLVGTLEAEERFYERFLPGKRRSSRAV